VRARSTDRPYPTGIMMNKFKNLLIFLEAAQSNSFAEAARKLDLAPSTVSKAISRLEDNIGIPLFHRSARSFQLTAEGNDRYKQLLSQIDQIEVDIRNDRTNTSDTLRLYLAPAFSQHHIIPKLSAFLQQYFGHLFQRKRVKIDKKRFIG
jgi:LysR family transcriptional regulator, regulator for bpeEF and oprC